MSYFKLALVSRKLLARLQIEKMDVHIGNLIFQSLCMSLLYQRMYNLAGLVGTTNKLWNEKLNISSKASKCHESRKMNC